MRREGEGPRNAENAAGVAEPGEALRNGGGLGTEEEGHGRLVADELHQERLEQTDETGDHSPDEQRAKNREHRLRSTREREADEKKRHVEQPDSDSFITTWLKESAVVLRVECADIGYDKDQHQSDVGG